MNTPARSGEIYDLGYRNYDGPRLGRRYAIRSLTALSLRNTFGLGRGVASKIIAFALTFFALVPALVHLAIGALTSRIFGDVGEDVNFELVRHEDYYENIQVILILFVAAMASDLVGNDRKSNTLPLYFSRPIERSDYVLAKIGALTLGLQMLTLLPQLVVFFGNWLGAPSAAGWIGDNVTDLPLIVASALLVSAELAALAILIATYAVRRAFALVSILGVFLLTTSVTAIFADLLPAGAARVVMCLSPIYVTTGVTLVLFDAVPPERPMEFADSIDDQIGAAGFPGVAWIAICLAHIALATWFSIRRYRDTI